MTPTGVRYLASPATDQTDVARSWGTQRCVAGSWRATVRRLPLLAEHVQACRRDVRTLSQHMAA